MSLTCIAVMAGCATQTKVANIEIFVERAPAPRFVPRASVLVEAQRFAARTEGDFVLRGLGNSMEPVYRSGTVVVVHPTAMHMLRKGMPVVFANARGQPVSHMLLEKTEAGWRTIGLNNAEPDATLVTARNLLGIVKAAFAPDDLELRVEASRVVAVQDTDRT